VRTLWEVNLPSSKDWSEDIFESVHCRPEGANGDIAMARLWGWGEPRSYGWEGKIGKKEEEGKRVHAGPVGRPLKNEMPPCSAGHGARSRGG